MLRSPGVRPGERVSASDAGPRLPDDRRLPLATRLAPEHPAYELIIDAHEAAVQRGLAGYLDPLSGSFVFTAAAHWERGTCCVSGCRHCPYVAGTRGGAGASVPAQPDEPGTW